MDAKERRRAPRVERAFMMKYRCRESGRTEWLLSPVKNLSSTGVRFISECEFAVGSELELQLHLPTAQQPVELKGVVVWQRRLGSGSLAELGVAFSNVDPPLLQRIGQALEFFLKHRASHGE